MTNNETSLLIQPSTTTNVDPPKDSSFRYILLDGSLLATGFLVIVIGVTVTITIIQFGLSIGS